MRETVAVMPQDSVLFSGTIRENLLYGKEVSEEEMKKRIAELNLTSLIESLPQGYDTLVKDASLFGTETAYCTCENAYRITEGACS